MRSSFLAKCLAGAALSAVLSSPADADCTCRYKGGETSDGQTVCIVTAKGGELAVCEKVLNVTSWKFLGKACPTAAYDGQPISLPPARSAASG